MISTGQKPGRRWLLFLSRDPNKEYVDPVVSNGSHFTLIVFGERKPALSLSKGTPVLRIANRTVLRRFHQ
jgi:hypothetical protein